MASASSSSPSPSSISIPNISTLVSIKLSETNYLPWESQVKPFLIGHNFWRFVDGSYLCHPPIITTAAPVSSPPSFADSDTSTVLPFVITTTPNPEYLAWYQTDQTLVSMLRATLTEPILALTVGLSTSREIWEHLRQIFSQQSLANATHYRFQLFSLQKGTKSIANYLGQAKALADQLASIGQPIANEDLVSYVLRGLGPEYSVMVAMLTNFPPFPSFNELRSRLLFFESQQTIFEPPASTSQAFYSAHNGGNGSSGSRNNGRQPHRNPAGNSGFCGTRGPGCNGRFTQVPANGGAGLRRHNHGTHHGNSTTPGLFGSSPNSCGPQCWACSQYGHIGIQCPQTARGEDDLSRAFAGMHVASSSDPYWYPDIGATYHMTSDARSMTSATGNSQNGQVIVGNGDALPIAHTGTGMFSYTTYEDQTNEPHFLDACHLCRKPLGNNSDIFMYRGNTPFCSKDYRQEEIKFDENKEKSWKVTSSRRKSDPNKNSTPNKNARTGSVAVA